MDKNASNWCTELYFYRFWLCTALHFLWVNMHILNKTLLNPATKNIQKDVTM